MKYLLLITLYLFHFNPSNGCSLNNLSDTASAPKTESTNPSGIGVYICTGPYAYTYHSRLDCPGFTNCRGERKYTDQSYAMNTLGRVPCCRCWTNTGGRCKDDNPAVGGGGGGGDNSAEAVIAIAIITVGAIILSNDVYAYPVRTFFYNYERPKIPIYTNLIDNVTGWAFGFRKTFDYAALEYGATYFEFNKRTAPNQTINPYQFTKWGWHFNFVHDLFYYRTPERLKFYVGPSINYIWDFGYGGITGAQFKLFDRLKLDVRYEWTTQSNQLQAGLIFTYQKEYFW
ncbi:MAG: hypothetical protein Q8J69_10835 [Sphingobacteriaceae bacterium]|nr:hypothetical protein [Sphingobacteriaceae bacterium]